MRITIRARGGGQRGRAVAVSAKSAGIRALTTLTCVLALALALLIANLGYWQARSIALPAPSGALGVARDEILVSDSARTDPLSPNGAMPRRFSLFVWYPTSERSGRRAAYAPGLWMPAMAAERSFGDVSPAAVRIAALVSAAPAAGKFPLLIFEPGYGRTAIDYSAFIQDIVSHGYVVAAITPTFSVRHSVVGNTIARSTAAGRPDESDETTFETALRSRILPQWSKDFSSAHTVLMRQRQTSWFGAIDFSRVGLIGHSLGGAAAFVSCPSVSWCATAVDLDGRTFDAVEDQAKPRLLIDYSGSRQDLTGLRHIAFKAPTSAPHMAITDSAWLTVPIVAHFTTRGSRGPDETLHLIVDSLLSFLDRKLGKTRSEAR